MPSDITSNENIVKISAAGSGKTWDICHDALELSRTGKRTLIVSYTNRGVMAIEDEICHQNCGVLDKNITIKTWFSFLLSDMIKPYQHYVGVPANYIKSIDFSQEFGFVNMYGKSNRARYLNGRNVRSNNVSELAIVVKNLSKGKTVSRLEEIYTRIFFDEIQDLVGCDLDVMTALMDSEMGVTCAGDNKQATFSTHNTRKNKRITGKNIWQFFSEYQKHGQIVTVKNLTSRRFNAQICSFANDLFPIGDPISTCMTATTGHDGVFLIRREDIERYYDTYKPQVLRYDRRTNTSGFTSVNFGACKGETFDRVMIFPNGLFKDYILKKKPLATPEKYYVAVTRPQYSIAFVMDKLPKKLDRYEDVEIDVEDGKIEGKKYISAS